MAGNGAIMPHNQGVVVMSNFRSTQCDVGAEMDSFREALGAFNSVITKDEHDSGTDYHTGITTVEYINGEGDAPFVKYRLTLEAISQYSAEEYAQIKQEKANEANSSGDEEAA